MPGAGVWCGLGWGGAVAELEAGGIVGGGWGVCGKESGPSRTGVRHLTQSHVKSPVAAATLL